MQTRKLGKTGLEITELALGGLFMARLNNEAEFGQARAAVLRALEGGINYIDTAPNYGNSEEVLGKIIKDVKVPLVISTKLGHRDPSFNPQNPQALKESVKQSLRFLHRDHIDILMIHEPDRPKQYAWWTDMDNFHGPVMEVMDECKREGLIRFTGLGGTTAYELARLIDTGQFDVVLTAFNYSLLWREAENEIIPLAKKHGMGIISGSPLQQGALARRYDEQVNDLKRCKWLSKPRREQFKALYALLDEIQIPIAELGMRFVLSNPDFSCVLTGARSVQEVELNLAAQAKGPLAADILRRLDKLAAMVPFRPYEEPFGMRFGSDDNNQPGKAGR